MSMNKRASNGDGISCASCNFAKPTGVQNREAVLNLAATQLAKWYKEYSETYENSLSESTKYPLPPAANGNLPRATRFLGAIFSRIGQAGAVRPTNQFKALRTIFDDITKKLLATLRFRDMVLPGDAMQSAADKAYQLAIASPGKWGHGLPVIPPGVIATLPDYNQLALISQRECIPVSHIHRHHLRCVNTKQNALYEAACLQASTNHQPAPPLPADHILLQAVTKDKEKLVDKTKDIRKQMEVVLELIVDQL